MATISEARTEVQREMQQLVALVDRPSQQTAIEVESSLWSVVLRLEISLMALFFAFAHQAAKWPRGPRYEVSGVSHEVQGADVAEIGTKFGKVSVLQPMGRELARLREVAPDQLKNRHDAQGRHEVKGRSAPTFFPPISLVYWHPC